MRMDVQVESYLQTVSAQLGAASFTERDKINAEIAAHIHDSTEQKGETVDAVLARLGPPQKLGERYREILATCQASRSYSPVVLLMTSFRKGILGITAALIGLAGYWLGGILLVFGILALIWAALRGGPHNPVPIGTSFTNIFEILGSGCLLLVFSTILLQATLRLLRRRHSPV